MRNVFATIIVGSGITLLFLVGCNGCNKETSSTSTATDSTSTSVTGVDSGTSSMSADTSTTHYSDVNSRYFDYENLGEIKTDSTLEVINEIRTLSPREFRQKRRLLKDQQKNCEKGKIIKKPGTFRFSLKGLDFFVKNQKVVGVGSLDLSQDALSAITEKLAIIDDVLYYNCLKLNREFSLASPSDSRINKLYDQDKEEIEALNNIGSTLNQLNAQSATSDKVKNALSLADLPDTSK